MSSSPGVTLGWTVATGRIAVGSRTGGGLADDPPIEQEHIVTAISSQIHHRPNRSASSLNLDTKATFAPILPAFAMLRS
jgi:hypothetical protein